MRDGSTEAAVREDCTKVYGGVFGPCQYPRCACDHAIVRQYDMQEKIRDKASRGDYD